MTRATILNEDDVNEIKRLYVSGEIKSKDKIAKKFNIDKRRVNRIFDEFEIESACSGYLKTFTEKQRDEIIRLYVEERLPKEEIGKIFKTSKHSIARLLEENNVKTLNNWERVKVVSVIDGDKYVETDDYTFIAKHKDTSKIFNDYKNISGSLIRYISEINPEIEIPSKHNRGVYYKKTGNYWYEQYFDIIKIPKNNNVNTSKLILTTHKNDEVGNSCEINNNYDSDKINVEIKKKRGVLFDEDIKNIIEGYTTGRIRNIDGICNEFKISKIKAKNILVNNGVELNKSGGQKKLVRKKHKDKPKMPIKYVPEEGYTYRAVNKMNGDIIDDFNNTSGVINKYLKEKFPDIKIPILDSEKYKYFIKTGDYWYEQYFDIVKVYLNDVENKTCPYCGKVFIIDDCDYLIYKRHLMNIHKIDYLKHLEKYEDDVCVFVNKLRIDKNTKYNTCNCKIKPKKVKTFTIQEDEFLNKSNETHNFKYDYSLMKYKGTNHKIVIICPKHGKFEQFAGRHSLGYGCPKCGNGKNLKENKLSDYLKNIFNEYSITTQASPDWLKPQSFDIYFNELNIAVEYQGTQHFKPVSIFGGETVFHKMRNLDINKNNLCVDNDCTLFYFTYDKKDIVDYPYYVYSNISELVCAIKEEINKRKESI